MRLLRMTTRRWMVGLAVLAVFIAAIRAATRPILTIESVNVANNDQNWSDGVTTKFGERPMVMETKHYPLCRLVTWSDGSRGLRLEWRGWGDSLWTHLLVGTIGLTLGWVLGRQGRPSEGRSATES